MAVARQHVTSVGTSATAIEGTQYSGYLLRNISSTEVIYLGDSAVTTANGFPLEPNEVFSPPARFHQQLQGRDDDRLYGIVASGTGDARVLLQGSRVVGRLT